MSEMSSIEFDKPLEIETTNIPGLLIVHLTARGDNRGWFKENWHREKMVALGLPDFEPVQNNVSFNAEAGVTRGEHAEPWDKFVSLGAGRIFGAWVDLREGDTFGQKFTLEIDPSTAIFVPRGVANGFQALEDGTVYSYLVNDHWAPNDPNYAFVNLADPEVGIDWPIPLADAELSDKDKAHPFLEDVVPVKPRKTLIVGAGGQVGKALAQEFPEAELADRTTFDVTDPSTWGERNWRQYQTIINAAAYTKVDVAETPEGRVEAWQANATAVKNLAKLAIENGLTLVSFSSDYVFDGTKEIHDEEEPFSPLGVYGQTKAAGDIAVATVPRHYNLRTSWVIGEGNNFVRTMKRQADEDKTPSVVNDQIGRLTFAADIARAIKHLLETKAPYGTYNVTSDGEPVSWKAIAAKVFELTRHDPSRVSGKSTEAYAAEQVEAGKPFAPRPLQSTLSLDKIKAAGFMPPDWEVALREYLEQQ